MWDRGGIVLSIQESLGRLQWSKGQKEGRKGMIHVANWVKSIPGNGWTSVKTLMFKEQ